jgi:hypothetical protein
MSGAWVWAGARAPGTSHLAQGLPCQDAFECAVWRCAGAPPVLIAALADGAGSAAQAETGSRYAAKLFVNCAFQAFDEGACPEREASVVLRHAAEQARLSLALLADRQSVPFADFATTLLTAVISPCGGAVGQIGDGAVVVDTAGAWRPVHWPDHGEYANTTSFLTQEDALDALRLATFDQPVRRIAMFSDGLERLVLDFRSQSAHGPFFDSILQRLAPGLGIGHRPQVSEEIAALLVSDKVNARTDDDKSLLCAAFIGG